MGTTPKSASSRSTSSNTAAMVAAGTYSADSPEILHENAGRGMLRPVMIGPDVMKRLEEVAKQRCRGAGPAHDWQHVLRVRANARRIAAAEGADPLVAATAALLHELPSKLE